MAEECDNTTDQSELEQEFCDLLKLHQKEIEAQVAKASEYLEKAIALSEKYGVPFNPDICFLNNAYIPKSFTKSKFAALDEDFLSEVTGIYDEYAFDGGGWCHSDIC